MGTSVRRLWHSNDSPQLPTLSLLTVVNSAYSMHYITNYELCRIEPTARAGPVHPAMNSALGVT
jgi:hypothetical protein